MSNICYGASAILNAFNSGELSPLLEGRTDIKRYYSGCRTLENMVVMAQGGVTKRPGTYYIAEAKSGSAACRLISFEYSTTQAYIIEMGNLYMRFYRDGAQITSGGSAYEITTTYATADLFEIQFIQSADTMYLFHREYAPRILTRSGHTSWTLSALDFSRGPFNTANSTTTTVTPSATTGTGITVTASSDIFNSNHVGALWEITHTVAASNVSGDLDDDPCQSSSLTIQNGRSYDFTTHGTWTGTVLLQRSYDSGTTWSDITSFSSADDGNISYSDSESVDDATYRVYLSSYTSGTCSYVLLARSFDVDGVVDITAVTDACNVTADVDYTLGGTTAVTTWAEGSWSPDEGYPSCGAFFEERLAAAATDNSPQTIWFSQTDDWDNFLSGTDDTDALSITIASDYVNSIRWLSPQTALLVGTIGGEWKISPEGENEGLTPTTAPLARRQSSYGSDDIQAIAINNHIIFIQRQGRKVRKLEYSFELDNWIAPDLTVLSEHITDSNVVQIALQKNPNPILWAVLVDGMLIGLTLEESHEVVGWHRHDLNGDVESVAVVPGANEDEVWVSVERTIDGSTVRYIEQMQPFDWGDDQEDAFFVDSGLSFDGGAAVNISTISQANPCMVVASAHGFSDGDQVRITDVGGMTELNENVYTVDDAGTNHFTLDDWNSVGNINSTSFTAYTSGGTVTKVENTFTTLTHLEGETVTIAADGGNYGTETVDGGTITLDDFYNTVHAGIGYTARLRPMKLEMNTNPGALFGEVKKLTEVVIRFYDTLACDVGVSWTDYESYSFREVTDPLEAAPPLYRDDKTIDMDAPYGTSGDIYIQSRLPLPLTILALKAKFEVYP